MQPWSLNFETGIKEERILRANYPSKKRHGDKYVKRLRRINWVFRNLVQLTHKGCILDNTEIG